MATGTYFTVKYMHERLLGDSMAIQNAHQQSNLPHNFHIQLESLKVKNIAMK